MNNTPQVVAYGGGVNSAAMLVGLHARGERPDAIVFADTGGERPETYAHIEKMREWCASVGFPDITRVQQIRDGKPDTLEAQCLHDASLPSLAYGFKTCSQHFKRRPSEKWMRSAFPFGDVVKFLGFDAGEHQRADRAPARDGRFVNRYPLIEWGWDRDECVKQIRAAGVEVPGKSSCFFCPAMKVREILALPKELQDRALAIEDGAKRNLRGNVIAGLGRNFSWRALLATDAAQGKLEFPPPIACECYDGDDEAPAAGDRGGA